MTQPSVDLRLPIVVMTGLLGSGKTTFLRGALDDGSLNGALLLVNEAAPFGVDDVLLGETGRIPTLLSNGCLCCKIDTDVKAELHRILQLDRKENEFNRLVVELSGLADPLVILATITTDPYLNGQIRIELVATLVDCVHGKSVAASESAFRPQIEAADVLLFSKTDMVDPGELESTRALVLGINPLAPTYIAAAMSLKALFDGGNQNRADIVAGQRFGRRSLDPLRSFGVSQEPNRALQCTAAEPVAFCLKAEGVLPWTPLALWLSLLLHRHGASILRVKGFLNLEGTDEPVLINCVRHIAYFPEHLPRTSLNREYSFLICIVRDLDPDLIARSFRAFVAQQSTTGVEVEVLSSSDRKPGIA